MTDLVLKNSLEKRYKTRSHLRQIGSLFNVSQRSKNEDKGIHSSFMSQRGLTPLEGETLRRLPVPVRINTESSLGDKTVNNLGSKFNDYYLQHNFGKLSNGNILPKIDQMMNQSPFLKLSRSEKVFHTRKEIANRDENPYNDQNLSIKTDKIKLNHSSVEIDDNYHHLRGMIKDINKNRRLQNKTI